MAAQMPSLAASGFDVHTNARENCNGSPRLQTSIPVVDDPKNVLLATLECMLAPLSIADIAAIAKVADIRHRMRESDIAKLGDSVKRRTDIVDKVKGDCRLDLE
ncbi:uncharacterized protein FFMR_06611 [Fusarium fujikuroi]|nr:uncharacterized protein FFE2_07854 [Fusarium fujikuroi]SCO41984.1 uncharacterized protein FFMR_06611 [Fusarium fujikuroi]SCV33091.1 uncharacterized protein FFFS_03613 [Fusarium fujikuroi]VTT82176.1 unnamed protein product [Fusarium fujikuroi]